MCNRSWRTPEYLWEGGGGVWNLDNYEILKFDSATTTFIYSIWYVLMKILFVLLSINSHYSVVLV